MGATFALAESVVANQRQKDDALNGVAGGCAAGFLAGIRGACWRIQGEVRPIDSSTQRARYQWRLDLVR